MDINDNVDIFSRSSMLFLSFLEKSPCQNQLFKEELNKLCDSNLYTDPHVYSTGTEYGLDANLECDGELESDGHCPTVPSNFIRDIRPQVHLDIPLLNAEEAEAVRAVSSELIRIADDLNYIIETQAVDSLTKMFTISPVHSWQNLLTQSVENLLKDVPGAHTEQVIMALTFSLVKAVCERAPLLLRSFFNVLVEYIFPARIR